MIKLVDLLLEAPIKQVVPEFLYHATYEALIPSIKRTGLDSREGELSWEFSIPGTVYLANDPDVAESYAEAAEEVSDEVYDSGIVVLKVASKDLDIDKLFDCIQVISLKYELSQKPLILKKEWEVKQ